MAKTVFTLTSAPAGYGPSIFVPHEHCDALRPLLNPLSTWQSPDKDTGKCMRWEFPSSDMARFVDAVQACASHGYEVQEVDASNHREVWR